MRDNFEPKQPQKWHFTYAKMAPIKSNFGKLERLLYKNA